MVAFMLTGGCNSLKFNNIVKTGTTTAVTYAIAGPAAGVANLLVSVSVDEIMPEEPKIANIETKEQAVAHVLTEYGMYSLYAFIAFLLITNLAVPFFTRRWGYNQAKEKYKRRHDD